MSQKKPSFEGGNRSIAKALNRLADALWRHGVNPGGRPGWVETKDGWMPPFAMPGSAAADSIWDLRVTDNVAGKFEIDCGEIIASAKDLTTGVAIVDATDEFTATLNHIVYLKMEGFAPTTITLVSGAEWQDPPGMAKTTGSGASTALDFTAYPLWQFVGTATSKTIQVADGIHAKRIAPNTHFLLSQGIYRDEATSNRPIVVHVLHPHHGLLA
jgi:hypothetical protein